MGHQGSTAVNGSSKPCRIVFLDRGTIGPGVTLRAPGFPHQWVDYERTAAAEVVERLTGARIAILNKVPLGDDALARLPELELVVVAATGTDVVDLDACRRRGVQVSNIQGYAAVSVAEHALAAMLALRRNLFEYREQVRAGAWQAAGQFCFFNRPIGQLAGSTLGIVGTGAIAAALGDRARALGMRVLHHSLSGRRAAAAMTLVGLDELLRDAAVVSLHCPLTPERRGLIGRWELQCMRAEALLINTARGELVDLAALEDALETGALAGAALDVAPVEPPPRDSVVMRLARRPDVLVTPHVGWASVPAMQALADQLLENLESFMAGEPVRLVT